MAARLTGKRIMVIEDEYFVASDLKRAFRAEGADVLGPTADVSAGLAMIADQAIDVAVLDVNLEGSDSYPIADALHSQGVPYVFVTGYDAWSMPEKYRDAARVGKPFRIDALVDQVAKIIGTQS